jgi:hypothetical protein
MADMRRSILAADLILSNCQIPASLSDHPTPAPPARAEVARIVVELW